MRFLSPRIHSRPPQQRRFLLPAMVATAVAALAAAILITPTESALADTSTGTLSEDHVCAGLTSGEVQVTPGKSATAATTSTNADCRVSVSLASSTFNKAGTACTVSFIPRASGLGAIELEVSPSANCEGVSVNSTIHMSGVAATPSSKTAEETATSTSTRIKTAKLVAHDVVSIAMFWHYATASWTYDSSMILSATGSTHHGDNQYWHTHSVTPGSRYGLGNTQFYQWHNVSWHSDGFPSSLSRDVYASSRVMVQGGVGGSYACTGSVTWGSGSGWYPPFHYHQYCY